MTKDRALKLALEALDNDSDSDDAWHQRLDAKTAIKEALTAPVQEPHCYMDEYGNVEGEMKGYMEEEGGWFPVYTTPPAAQRQYPQAERAAWVGLTDEEMYLAIRPLFKTDALAQASLNISKDEYRAIEAKLKEKNT